MKTRLFFAKESASAGNCSFRVAEKTRATPVIISIDRNCSAFLGN